MMKRKGFTLVEILIVIVIISILLALSLGITGGRVQILREKYAQEQLISTYNTLFSRNFLTNYYNGIMYENLVIQMKKGEQGFIYTYNTGLNNPIYTGKTSIEGNVVIKNLSGNSSNIDEINIIFEPYKFGCRLSGVNNEFSTIDMTLRVDNKKNYCYRIDSKLCRLEKLTDCDGEN